MAAKKILSVKETAQRLGLSTTTLWRLRVHGDFIPQINLSKRRIGFSEEAIDRWEAGRVGEVNIDQGGK